METVLLPGKQVRVFREYDQKSCWILSGKINTLEMFEVVVQAGVDVTLIKLWLGHESLNTTHMYVEADLAMKERALAAVQPPRTKQTRYQPTDRVMEFLQML
jgi:hypothetical protein